MMAAKADTIINNDFRSTYHQTDVQNHRAYSINNDTILNTGHQQRDILHPLLTPVSNQDSKHASPGPARLTLQDLTVY